MLQDIAVIGMGKSGVAAARFLLSRRSRVRVTDGSSKPQVLKQAASLRKEGALVETGGHTAGFLEGAKLIVTSPGVPKHSIPLLVAKKKKIPVISEIELAYLNCSARIVGLTGTNGKTTTCNLIHAVLRAARRRSVLCGNIGYSFLEATRTLRRTDTVVLELSSFQLEDSPRFRPSIAVVLNISPNHLDRHKTLARYAAAKERIFANQKASDHVVLNYDDARVRRMASKARSKVVFFSKRPIRDGVYYDSGRIWTAKAGKCRVYIEDCRFKLQGPHNLENILAAASTAWVLGIKGSVAGRVFNSFGTLEHRIEPAGILKGVEYINDSKSTTIESTRAAILAMKKPVILIAGGRDKGSDFTTIERTLDEKVKSAVLYGESREKIRAAFKKFDRCALVDKFADAVRLAGQTAGPGDVVLLSPMCASFDQFSCFEERGEVFKELVREMARA